MKSSIMFFALACLAGSCNKSGKGYVRGTVTDSATGVSVEGAPIYVIDHRREGKGKSESFHDTVGRTQTSADGTYKIEFYKSRSSLHRYTVFAGKHLNYKRSYFEKELMYRKTAVNFLFYN